MPAIYNHIRRHRPLITPRIEFQLAPRPPLPLITPRLEFDLEELASSASRLGDFPPRSARSSDSSSESSMDTDDEPEPEAESGPPPVLQSVSPVNANPVTTPALIPKPNGEPGRPGSGGFNLEATLRDVHKWSKKDIDDLIIFVRSEATKTLNTNVCFRSQKKPLIDMICEKASAPDLWPVLTKYENCWPVRSALKLILKYQSEASRRNEYKGVASRLRSAVLGERRESSAEL